MRKRFRELDLYEGDIVYAGGVVNYSGCIVKKGIGYTVEKATIMLGDYVLCGYMKKYRSGNAVLCANKSNIDNNMGYMLVKDKIASVLRKRDMADDNFFTFRAVRELLTLFLNLVIFLLVLFSFYCFCQFLGGFYTGFLAMIGICMISIAIMNVLKVSCKTRLPYGYQARSWLTAELRECYLPYEPQDFDDL